MLFKNIYQGKTVLITGDTGFKGSWLAIWLLELGARVIGYSLEPKSTNDNYVVSGLDKLITHVTGDINDYPKLSEVFARYQPEIVFHLAAQALVLESYKDPGNTFRTNIMGTVNIFEAARKMPSVKVVVNVTSDKCYDNREWIYSYREIDPLGGKDPYSASKGASEIVTNSYFSSFFSQEGTANIASARAGNVIGGGDWSPHRIFPDCIRALSSGSPVIIRNPNAVRPWQHVLEPLCGYLTLGSLLYTEGKKYSGAWNFGPLSKNMIFVEELVTKIIRQWGNGSYQVERPESPEKEANLLQLDISKAINWLNWFPVLNANQTIELAVAEYKIDGMSEDRVYHQRLDHIQMYLELREKQFEV